MDVSVLLITDATLMPDTKVLVLETNEKKKGEDIVGEILEDLMKDMVSSPSASSLDLERTFINSLVVEVKVENPPEGFILNLFIKPKIDIVSKNVTCSLNKNMLFH